MPNTCLTSFKWQFLNVQVQTNLEDVHRQTIQQNYDGISPADGAMATEMHRSYESGSIGLLYNLSLYKGLKISRQNLSSLKKSWLPSTTYSATFLLSC